MQLWTTPSLALEVEVVQLAVDVDTLQSWWQSVTFKIFERRKKFSEQRIVHFIELRRFNINAIKPISFYLPSAENTTGLSRNMDLVTSAITRSISRGL
jgi:hypothetical protein